MRDILIINAGSSSLKFSLFREKKELYSGAIEEIATESSRLLFNEGSQRLQCATFGEGAVHIAALLKKENSIPDGVGYRLVFGGEEFVRPTILDESVLQKLSELIPFAPLHMPQELEMIQSFRRLFPHAYHLGCFDTAFHAEMPEKARLFPFPSSIRSKGVRRFGFHGLSYEYISKQPECKGRRVIVAHLGSGCSLCAMSDGQSIDTSMGFTPLGGIPMCTRTGDLDPGILLFLLKDGMSIEALEHLVEKESGLLGLSGVSKDMNTLLESSDPNAYKAVEYFCYEVAKKITALVVGLGGIDALVFTAGIGERAAPIRSRICEYLTFLGVSIDPVLNQRHERVVSESAARVEVLVIPTDEALTIVEHFYNN